MGSALQQLRLRTPRATIVASCTICGKRGLSDGPTFTHTTCLAKPRPCTHDDCEQPSMPYPPCTHCKGSGRLADNNVCVYCPPGPCIGHSWKTLHARIVEARTTP